MTSVSRSGSARRASIAPGASAAVPSSAVAAPLNSFIDTDELLAAKTSPVATPRALVQPRPIEINSNEGHKFAADAAQELGRNFPDFPNMRNYTVRSVDRDMLGMTHVRMDRMHNGLPVFGEQSIVHFGADGRVRGVTGEPVAIDATLGTAMPTLSGKDAAQIAQQTYGKAMDGEPTVVRVIAQGDDGKYHDAYQVSTERLTAGDRPEKMQYLVDSATGNVISSWNAIGGIQLPATTQRNSAIGDPMSSDASATVNAAINDLQTVTSKVTIDKDMDVDSLMLDLDITHPYKGDLRITLVSPSGTEYTVLDRQGGTEDNVKETFNLSDAAKSEMKTLGEWTLKVEDTANGDVGMLNNWALHAKGREKDPNPPPPPPPPPPGSIDDKSLYAGMVALGTTRDPSGKFSLNDSSRGLGVETRDAMNRSSASGSQEIKDNNDIWGEAADPSRNAAAVDAQYGGQMTYDLLKDMFGRNSINGNGEKLVSNVHINTNYVNAYWDGRQMHYGDGDGRQASVLTSLDVAGHEIVHGLTERTAGLIYRGESGGLNEGMSDIIGGFGVEWYAMQHNPSLQADVYRIGDQVWTPGTAGDALRYMDDPTKDGRSLDNFSRYTSSVDVHYSSGIANNAFTLLVKGGTNKTSGRQVNGGIGAEKSLQIFYRALTSYMTPSTTFAQAKQACLKAATDLYGADSAEVAKTAEVWTAVGVN